MRVVVTDLGYPDYEPEKKSLSAVGAELVLHDYTGDAGALVEACREADGLLNRSAPLTAEVIGSLQRCRVIVRYGVGYDNVDVPAATKKGIVVCNVPEYCTDEVAEQAAALLLSAGRKITSRDRAVRRGEWDIQSRDPIRRLRGKTLGFVGFGKIARAVARKLSGMEFRVLVCDPFVDESLVAEHRGTRVELEQVMRECDFITVHAPLSDATRHMIGKKQIGLMKPDAVIVNTARGGVIDTAALAEALAKGRIGGAGLDVFETEPLEAESPLRGLENVILTDHAGWYSEDSIRELQRKAAEEAARVLSGKKPLSPVNPAVLEK